VSAHPVVSHDDWVKERQRLLAREKAFTRERDALSRERRELPWEKVEKKYVFDGPEGKETLADLFGGKSQLLVYHFMFGVDWEQGCPSCSFWADNFNGIVTHLKQRDTTMVAISRAPLPKLEAFKKRMGWSFSGPRPATTASTATTAWPSPPRKSGARRLSTTTSCRIPLSPSAKV
jgi:predicted dithiol-disulfide oxidoreductase (DUF899 family)